MKHLIILIIFLCPVILIAQVNSVQLEAKPVPKPTKLDTAVANWNARQPGYNTLNQQAKDFFYWTNYSRANPKRFWDSVVAPALKTFPNLQGSYTQSLKADLYASPGLPLFKLNPILLKTSQAHASDIGLKQAPPGHISTNGESFVDRVKSAGIVKCAGENISIGDVDPLLSLVLLYVDYGLPQLGHRKTLLNATYVETGIGVSPYGNTGNIFIVEDFACSQDK